MSVPALGSRVCYSNSNGSVVWEGRTVENTKNFQNFLKEVVRTRVMDGVSPFESDLHGLATTGMATEFVERLLRAVPEPENWEIGEALADCALQHDSGREVVWPWNTVCDRRTPRASLPGADLVGFFRDGDNVLLLFGEVKTSSEVGSPPNVMYGGSGMTWQLEENATRLDVQHALLRWLHARCQSVLHRELYSKAVGQYLASGGKKLLLVGVLIRDTEPNELDLKNRAKALAKKLRKPTRVEIIAWYLPVAIQKWAKLLSEDAH